LDDADHLRHAREEAVEDEERLNGELNALFHASLKNNELGTQSQGGGAGGCVINAGQQFFRQPSKCHRFVARPPLIWWRSDVPMAAGLGWCPQSRLPF